MAASRNRGFSLDDLIRSVDEMLNPTLAAALFKAGYSVRPGADLRDRLAVGGGVFQLLDIVRGIHL
jgi:hypothetical protein